MIKRLLVLSIAAVLLFYGLPCVAVVGVLPSSMGFIFFIATLLFINPIYFGLMGCFLAKYIKKLWWFPLAAVGNYYFAMFYLYDTDDGLVYIVPYLLICYVPMVLCALSQRRVKRKADREKMMLQDLS